MTAQPESEKTKSSTGNSNGDENCKLKMLNLGFSLKDQLLIKRDKICKGVIAYTYSLHVVSF